MALVFSPSTSLAINFVGLNQDNHTKYLTDAFFFFSFKVFLIEDLLFDPTDPVVELN